jgi:hypothetical protein
MQEKNGENLKIAPRYKKIAFGNSCSLRSRRARKIFMKQGAYSQKIVNAYVIKNT